MAAVFTWTTEDEVHGGTWGHFHLEDDENVLLPVDFKVDQLTPPRRVIESRGLLSEWPDVFTAIPRDPDPDGRPKSPYYIVDIGISLPPEE